MKDNTMRGPVFLAALLCAAAVGAADLPTKEITSNNIFGLTGSGDTLWMATDQGLNYTIASSDTLTWSGYKASFRVISLAFGAKAAVVCLDTTKYLSPNKLWFYDHFGHSYDSLQVPYHSVSISNPDLRDSAVFMANGVAFCAADSAFWLSCLDGGLVRFDPKSKSLRAFFPGIRQGFDPASVRIDSVAGIKTAADLAAKRIIAVAVQKVSKDTTAILALTRTTLYRFFPHDSSWDTLSSRLDRSQIIDRYHTVFGSNHSPYVFASIAARGHDEPKLYRYSPADTAWEGFDSIATAKGIDSRVTGLTFGPDSVTYLIRNFKSIHKLSGKIYDTLSIDSFDTRITRALGNPNPEFINDILYLPRTETSGSFWIATSSTTSPAWNGLFFSRREEIDEHNLTPFVYVRRDRKINSGLKETYAVPGILSSGASGSPASSQAVFAYSLSKASDVTINIYDWNMNLVKNIISNRHREAGKDDPLGNGRSTNRREDSWDGTNSAGKRVAVGVYYFKIFAKSGERSFGKIIVAK
jgi:hypothetical protein